MSAAILDQVRAFETIASLLEASQRDEIAKALGERLLAEISPAKKSNPEPRHIAETLPDPERLVFDETAQFLADHGYSSADQVRAAGRLEEFLKKHSNLTREAGRILWLHHDREGEKE